MEFFTEVVDVRFTSEVKELSKDSSYESQEWRKDGKITELAEVAE